MQSGITVRHSVDPVEVRLSMRESEDHVIEVGDEEARRIAVRHRAGATPTLVWFGGFRSDMGATKATALDAWAGETGRACLRFDYSGHGESSGRFEDGTIGRWCEEAGAAVERLAGHRPIYVGSSMGAWIALLVGRAMRSARPERAPAGLVLIAPAVDFTERLMWDAFSPAERAAIERDGVYRRPSLYGEPYPITHGLIEEGRRHLMLSGPILPGCPVHVLQGMHDPDVPWRHALALVERLPADDVQLTLVKDGDHRLSRPQDLDLLRRSLDAMAARVAGRS